MIREWIRPLGYKYMIFNRLLYNKELFYVQAILDMKLSSESNFHSWLNDRIHGQIATYNTRELQAVVNRIIIEYSCIMADLFTTSIVCKI